jgi:hypothetical protein
LLGRPSAGGAGSYDHGVEVGAVAVDDLHGGPYLEYQP